MSETPTTPTIPGAQAAFLESLTDEARLDRALELTRRDLAQLEQLRRDAGTRTGRLRAELYTAVVAELDAGVPLETTLETTLEATA